MEITIKEYQNAELISIKGRIDNFTIPKLNQAFEDVNNRGTYSIVVDMSQLEYMSSAGLRALVKLQHDRKRINRGEIILVNVSDQVRTILELSGLRIFNDSSLALEFAARLPGDPTTDAPPPKKKY